MPVIVGIILMLLCASACVDWDEEGAVAQFVGFILIGIAGGGIICWFLFTKVLAD